MKDELVACETRRWLTAGATKSPSGRFIACVHRAWSASMRDMRGVANCIRLPRRTEHKKQGVEAHEA